MGAQAESYEATEIQLTEVERERIKATIARIRDDQSTVPVPRRSLRHRIIRAARASCRIR